MLCEQKLSIVLRFLVVAPAVRDAVDPSVDKLDQEDQ